MSKNVWNKVESILREVFPYPYPETNYKGQPLKEEEKEDYYDSADDPLILFLTEGKVNADQQFGIADQRIEFVEFEGSFYENVDYDDIPQGTEDPCDSVIKIDDQYYKIGLHYTSYSGYLLSWTATEVSPKIVEVVIYE